ncbi:hypothetical protein [Shewanella sp. VB17]|uniref:hypothetical protein n=1 Tax=Shewanella sp. VB17 TaxID=2739432 RepID=UPI001C265811|nr:hypothetical protein [Shewanella sp. VB17]
MKGVLSAASEFNGRFIAYGGGSGVFVFSNEVAAKAQQAAEITQQIPISMLTVQSLVSIGGLVVIAGRLGLDIYKEVTKRHRRKNQHD